MKSQPNRDYASDDCVQTPRPLARAIVQHFKPSGLIMEPCQGERNFYMELIDLMGAEEVHSMEIKEGLDFLDPHRKLKHMDWIVTNPPWSQFRKFLNRSMEVADNIVFLITINHVWTKARVRDVREAGFGIKEILLCEMPKTFPQSGFQLGAIHWQRGWTGDIKLSSL
jgi:hypothetical protein